MKLKKIAGLMMACVMAVSCLAVSASAAELEEQAMSIVGNENVYAVSDMATLSSEEIGNIDDLLPIEEGIMPLASGELSAGKGYTYGSVSISAGQKITISGSYTPTNAKLQVGYVNSSGTVTYVTLTGGSGSHTFSVSKTGTYQIYVGNPSSYDVEFDVSYIVT